jgi:tryptophan synthase alpha chain
VVLMGYANPVERYDQQHGAGAFVRDAAAAGVDGVLVVDYPPEECAEFAAKLKAAGMDLIFLLAPPPPTSACSRWPGGQRLRLLRLAQGRDRLGRARHRRGGGHAAAHPPARHIPVGVGFGIRDAETARAIGQVADAVVIGSRLIQQIEQQPHERVAAAAADFLRPIRAALDA